MEGTIQKLADGWGFIHDKKGNRYYFVARSIRNARFDDLEVGQEVSFEDEEGTRGSVAADIFVESN